MTTSRRLRRSLTRVLLMVCTMLLMVPATANAQVAGTVGPTNTITDVPGIQVGHETALGDGYRTGTTVVYGPDRPTTGYSQMGGASGTRETDLLNPGGLVTQSDAVVLSGGSAYGLDTASGVMRWLEERGQGHPVGGGNVVPIVPAAILYDLGRGGDFSARPDADFGYNAIDNASGGPVEQGRVGAGMGASRGLGTASVVLPNGYVVGAIVGLNPGGSPVNPSTCMPYGEWLELDGEFNLSRPSRDDCPQAYDDPPNPAACKQAGWYIYGFNSQSECAQWAGQQRGAASQSSNEGDAAGGEEPSFNTTIAVVATNAPLNQVQAERMAMISNSGLSRSIKPIHNIGDGDTVFAMATGDGSGNVPNNQLNQIYNGAADALGRAVVHAILNSTGVGNDYCAQYPSICANRDGTASSSSNTDAGDAGATATTAVFGGPAGSAGGEAQLLSSFAGTEEQTLLGSGLLVLLALASGLALYGIGRRRGRLATDIRAG